MNTLDFETPAVRVGHALIRAQTGDTFDPFFVPGSDDPHEILLGCFYYAVRMTRVITILYDNQGRGGMCDLTTEEIAAIWHTPSLLAALGTTIEALHEGSPLMGPLHVPAPLLTWKDLLPDDCKMA